MFELTIEIKGNLSPVKLPEETVKKIEGSVKRIVGDIMKREEDKKEQQIEEMVEIIQNSTTKSAEYFQSEVKKAFTNGSKSIKRSDCDKSIYDISAEDLYNAGYRKKEEVAKEILQIFMRAYRDLLPVENFIKDVAKKYGVEVE